MRVSLATRAGGVGVLVAALLVSSLATASGPSGSSLLEPLPIRTSEAIRWLRGYLRIDTTNPPGNETAGARYLERILRAEGIETEVVEYAPGRGNLIARLRGTGEKPALVLNHHIDVVSADPSVWSVPPFSGAIRGIRIYGRGAVDAKGPGMAQVAALVDLKRRRVPLARDVVLLATADEEMGGHLGVEALLARRPDLVKGVGAVLGEGGGVDVIVDEVQLWKIEIAQKRLLWLRLTAKGVGGHGAAPDADAPSHRLIRALARLLEWRPAPAVSELVQSCAKAQSRAKKGRKAEILSDLRATARTNPKEILDVFGPGLWALLVPTVGIGRFGGSANTNVLPAVATADIDLRIRPEDDAEAILREVRGLLAPERIEIGVTGQAPAYPPSPTDHELYIALEAFLRADTPGSVVAPMIQPGFSDGRHFRAKGIPFYGFVPIKINYYDAARIHGADELLRTDFFDEGTARLTRFLELYCGRSGSSRTVAPPRSRSIPASAGAR